MGWLTETRKGGELYYGDQSLDCCTAFLRKLGKEYMETDLGRLPTIGEILLNFEIVLGADLKSYCSDAEDSDLVSISAKTKKKPARPKAQVGDVLAIPFKRDLFGFGQVLETLPSTNGIIGIYPCVHENLMNVASLSDLEFAGQLRIELTGIPWKHWRIVGKLPLKPGLRIEKTDHVAPCFVAELKIVKILQESDLMDTSFRLYRDVRAMHPKLRPKYVEIHTLMMKFLQEQKLLSEDGLKEIASGDISDDFSMHSGLLTEKGRCFYDLVFKKDYQSDYFFTDIYEKLEKLWNEFQEMKI